MLDLEKLLSNVTDDRPSGTNLEDEVAFAELEALSKGTPEKMMGSAIIPAVKPDWKEVQSKSVDFFSKTKDLRIAVWLINSVSFAQGFSGLKDGLALLKGLLEQHWDSLFPELDPTDENPAMERNSTLLCLNDGDSTLAIVRGIPVVSSRGWGKYSIKDIDIASGKIKLPETSDQEIPQLTSIDAAFLDCPVEDIQEGKETVTAAIENLRASEEVIASKLGAGNGPNLEKLKTTLDQIEKLFAEKLLKRGVGSKTKTLVAETESAATPNDEGRNTAQMPVTPPGVISSREDVVRAIDKICEYYDANEPSSPVPIMLGRAKQLVSKNFMDILEDLVPDGAKQASKLLKGVK